MKNHYDFSNAMNKQDLIFYKKIKKVKLLNNELADYLEVSVPTIERWKQGKNLPHPLMQKSILKKLGKLSEK